MSSRPPLLGRRDREETSQRGSARTPTREYNAVRDQDGLDAAFAGTGAPLFVYVFVVALLASVVPLPGTLPADGGLNVLTGPGVLESVTAGMLMVPLGFLWRLSGMGVESDSRVGAARVLAAGAVGGAIVEFAQILSPGTTAALLDMPMAAAGAWVGAQLFEGSLLRVGEAGSDRRTEMLALDLPIASLLYLLVPLMWLNALALPQAPLATLRLLLLGLFGVSLFVSLQRRYLAPAGTLGRWGTAVTSTIAYLIAAFPALALRPVPVTIHAVIVGAVCGALASGNVSGRRTERRFEHAALQRAAPFLGVYLLLIPFVTPEYVDVRSIFSRVLLLELLQTAASSVLIGYMVAEYRGRRSTLYRDSLAWVVCAAAAVAGITGWLAGAVGTGAYGTIRLALAVAAAVLGGWLYHVQRDRVLSMVLEPREP